MPKAESYHEFIRAWTTDAEGREVMRGLTVQETAWYKDYRAKRLRQREYPDRFPRKSVEKIRKERGRWLALREKHELARIAVIAAEVELRERKPKPN